MNAPMVKTRKEGYGMLAGITILILLCALLVLSARPAHAATLTVDSGTDAVDANIGDGACATAAGSCTLRAAVQEANATAAADTIDFSTSSVTLSISDNKFKRDEAVGDLNLTQDVTINGGSGVSISAGDGFDDRIFHVPLPARATIENVTVERGKAPYGGGIYVARDARLDLSGSTVRDNVATSSSTAVGGGIYNAGTLTVTKSTISGNTNEASFGSYGGGLTNSETATITDSTISGNMTISFGGTTDARSWGGGIHNTGDLALTNVTVSGNSTFGHISNARRGGGIANNGVLTLTNVTLGYNSAPTGANLMNPGVYESAMFKNTVVVKPLGGKNCWGHSLTLISLGHNLASDGSCDTTATGDIQNQDPKLGPLQNNRGPTQTHALLAGSPAIDAANDTGCPSADQRGIARPNDGDNNGSMKCDIGAFELDVTRPNTTIDSGPSGTVSSTSATFEFSSNEPGVIFLCKLDGSPFFLSCSSPETYTSLSNGSHTFKVYARDPAGNFDPTPATRTWTVDTVKPTVKNVSPADGAVGVASAANVYAFFSEPMLASSINATTVRLRKAGTTTFVSTTVTYDATNKRAVLNPGANLEAGATYIANVSAGAKDVAGNALDQDPATAGNQPKTWRFTVK